MLVGGSEYENACAGTFHHYGTAQVTGIARARQYASVTGGRFWSSSPLQEGIVGSCSLLVSARKRLEVIGGG